MPQGVRPFCIDARAGHPQRGGMTIRHIALLALSIPSIAIAQTSPPAPVPTEAHRALAAGYRALTLCSALFNARDAGAERSVASVEANELVGVYPEVDPLVRDMVTRVTEAQVEVDWTAAMPPRVARHSAGRGCALLPVGTAPDWLSRTPPVMPPLIPAPALWPRGDLMPIEPHDQAQHAEAAAAGVDPDRDSPWIVPELQNGPVARAFDHGYGARANTTGVVVLSEGAIIAERYAPGFGIDVPQRTWSVAKSLAATIIGAAVQRGAVDVNAPAAVPQWQRDGDPRRAITLNHLLRMSSGLTSDTAGNRTDALYFGGVAVDEQAPGWPLIAAPGSRFRYANNDTLLAVLAVAPTFAEHAPQQLFARLAMHRTVAETDWRGNYILSSQVWTTARDLARFGLLYLNDGVWEGERILPPGWRTYVSTPAGPQPDGPFGYGAGFWLLNHSDGVPADTFAAFGNRGQYVVIVPSRNIVIVRRGEDPAGQGGFDIAAFTRDVLAALD